jgi:hypothetical protein
VIRKPQYRILSDLTPSGITRSASLAEAIIGAANNANMDRIFFIVTCNLLILISIVCEKDAKIKNVGELQLIFSLLLLKETIC